MKQEKGKTIGRSDEGLPVNGTDTDECNLTAGSPIQVQAVQSEIQSKVDSATTVSKAKESLQRKIGQRLQQAD